MNESRTTRYRLTDQWTSAVVQGIERISSLIGRSISWLVLVMVLIGAWNAIARFTDRETGSDLSSNTWLEAGWYGFALLFLFAAAWTLKQDAHVRVDVFYARFGPRGKAWIDLLGLLLLLIPFCIFMLWTILPSAYESWLIREQSPDPGGLARWPVRGAVPVAVVILLLQGIAMGLRALRVILGLEQLPEVDQSEPDEDSDLLNHQNI